MKISVILAHPDKASLNYAIAEKVVDTLNADGHEVTFHDLYREKFPSVIPTKEIPRGVKLPKVIEKHFREIAEAGGIVIVHPNWWGQPPAILKGWIDRILRPGAAYTFAEGDNGEGDLIGLLKAETLLVFNTSNTKPERESNLYGDPLELLWKNNIIVSCGVKNYFRRCFRVVITSTIEQRRAWLEEASDITRKHFPGAG
jgi:NAD(P)H dehydrogenase (quinone)